MSCYHSWTVVCQKDRFVCGTVGRERNNYLQALTEGLQTARCTQGHDPFSSFAASTAGGVRGSGKVLLHSLASRVAGLMGLGAGSCLHGASEGMRMRMTDGE